MKNDCLSYVGRQAAHVVELQSSLTAFQALGPENEGIGESEKADYIESCLRACRVKEISRFDSPDTRVPSGTRPNLVARIPGKLSRTLWLFAHTDVVPVGNEKLWKTEPWKVHVDGDFMYGRGVEDNQQAIVSMLLAAEALMSASALPDLSLGLVFMADEECGNEHGLTYLLKSAPDIFKKDDLYLVPDFGSPDGSEIEVAEKSLLWLKFTVTGKQTHGSTPQKGNNAFVAGADLALRLDALNNEYSHENFLFSPPYSTFTLTKHDANIPNVNTVPGTDTFYMDCRILPEEDISAVKKSILVQCRNVEDERKVSVVVDEVQCVPAAPATPTDSEIVSLLTDAVKSVYGITAKPVGIGGGTVAGLLRAHGYPVAVWSRILNTCHSPNEAARISSAIGDAQVFVSMLFSSSNRS